jgi:hypothetical protein
LKSAILPSRFFCKTPLYNLDLTVILEFPPMPFGD